VPPKSTERCVDGVISSKRGSDMERTEGGAGGGGRKCAPLYEVGMPYTVGGASDVRLAPYGSG
jgi:hypothetical protein